MYSSFETSNEVSKQTHKQLAPWDDTTQSGQRQEPRACYSGHVAFDHDNCMYPHPKKTTLLGLE